jgi:hypothetical protein
MTPCFSAHADAVAWPAEPGHPGRRTDEALEAASILHHAMSAGTEKAGVDKIMLKR